MCVAGDSAERIVTALEEIGETSVILGSLIDVEPLINAPDATETELTPHSRVRYAGRLQDRK